MPVALTFETLVPTGHKYAAWALTSCFTPPNEDVEVAPGLRCLAGLPTTLPQSWTDWRGVRELEQMRTSNLVLLATSPSPNTRDHDLEDVALHDWLRRVHGGLSIATPGYFAANGRTIGGAHDGDYLNARTGGQIVPYFAGCGTPSEWVITRKHITRALRVAAALEEIHRSLPGTRTDRLVRILHAFHMGLASNQWDVRLHQFCRVLDGLAATPRGKGRKTFGVRCCRMILDGSERHREFFERSYETRGAIEHVRGPVEEIRAAVPELKSDDDAYVTLAYTAFVLEQVARHALLHVCSTPNLWPHIRSNEAAARFWSDRSGSPAALWDAPLDVGRIQSSFNRAHAETALRLAR